MILRPSIGFLFLASASLASIACGPSPCSSTGKNAVTGTALATASNEKCVAEVSGSVDDGGGRTIVTVTCAGATVAEPRNAPDRRTMIVVLPDPRALDATAQVSVTFSSTTGTAAVPIPATVELTESVGAKAPLPAAVTPDFSRRATIKLSGTGGSDVAIGLTIRAADLGAAERTCGAD